MFDVIIIGKGPAGISASIYTKRANLKTLVIAKDGGALEKADKIENYYGFESISGKDLIVAGEKQAEKLGVVIKNEEVLTIRYEEIGFNIVTNKNEYLAKAVIIATGVNRPKLKLEGIEEFEGKGVSYCAICDAFFFKDKRVAVLGNGEYALHEINELMPIVKDVSLLTNGKEKIELRDDRIKVYDKRIKRLRGNNTLEYVEFEDESNINVSAVFVADGTASSVDFARRIGANIKDNKIIVDDGYMTNVPGLFAAGDCIGGLLQISKAVSDGAKAGISAINYIRSKE